MSSAGTTGVPAPTSVARERENCESANCWRISPTSGTFRRNASQPRRPASVARQREKTNAPRASAGRDDEDVRAEEVRRPDHDARDERELPGLEPREELPEARDHVRHEDRDEADGEADEDRRVDERPRDLPAQRAEDLLVGEKAPDDLLDLARALARLERRREKAREDVAVGEERVRERDARHELLADVRQDALETGVRLALEEDLEPGHDREPGLQERDELLVEDEELGRLHGLARSEARERRPRGGEALPRRRGGPDGEEAPVQARDLRPERALVGGLDRAHLDRAVRQPDPALVRRHQASLPKRLSPTRHS